MFSKDITGSDAFREMPPSSQALYFHLGMEADDDGFLDNYRGLIRSTNSSEDDLKVLIGKRFLIIFPSKIIAVKHWLINNTIRKDRYTATKHLDEKRALLVKENGSYTELIKSGIPDGNQVATQYRIGEDSKGKDRREKEPTPSEISKSFFEGGKYYDDIREEMAVKVGQPILDEELKKFNLYWTEPNKSGTRVRWEQEVTFDVRRRLVRWFSKVQQDYQKASSRGRGLA